MIAYVREVNYLSPSSLRQLEERPVEFYLRRLGPAENAPPSEPQSFPAAVGIAFDAFVKAAVAKELKLPCPSAEFMLREVRDQRDRALAMGAELLYGYKKCGAWDRLLSENPTSVFLDTEDYAPGTKVPIRSRIDARTARGVHDWKTTGANRPGTASPTQGYTDLWDTDQPKVSRGGHVKAGQPLEALDADWATQMTIYGWACGLPIGPVTASIDELVVGANNRLRVANFRTEITVEFQRKVIERLEAAWARIRERRVVPEIFDSLPPEKLRVMM